MRHRYPHLPKPRRRPVRRAFGPAVLVTALLATGTAPAAHAAGVARFDVTLEDGRPLREARTLEATAGDTVSLQVRSDTAVTLHLHGYDRELAVAAGQTAVLRLEAGVPGRFPIETHGGAGRGPILYLEIRPD